MNCSLPCLDSHLCSLTSANLLPPITVPRTFLWKCFELLDLQIQQQHTIMRNREESNRGRGLGTSAPLWQRLRSSCPKSVFYNGPILDGAGNQCRTDLDLSAAMLATRKFWFEPPVLYDPEWTSYLLSVQHNRSRHGRMCTRLDRTTLSGLS